jgi:hypothetical protein
MRMSWLSVTLNTLLKTAKEGGSGEAADLVTFPWPISAKNAGSFRRS